VHDPDGVNESKLNYIKDIKNGQKKSVAAYAEKYKNAVFTEAGKSSIWSIPADCAFPCATQNELTLADAKELKSNKLILLAEGANMPTTPDAIAFIRKTRILYGPGKAANAGGVAVSGLEMSQNRLGRYWTKSDLEKELRTLMKTIQENCLATIHDYGLKEHDYLNAANMSAFVKVSKAMMAQGIFG
jgi:glutamate dehydrogenase (NADP+)